MDLIIIRITVELLMRPPRSHPRSETKVVLSWSRLPLNVVLTRSVLLLIRMPINVYVDVYAKGGPSSAPLPGWSGWLAVNHDRRNFTCKQRVWKSPAGIMVGVYVLWAKAVRKIGTFSGIPSSHSPFNSKMRWEVVLRDMFFGKGIVEGWRSHTSLNFVAQGF